jgi:hypothetical protein
MATASEVLQLLRPDGGWVIVADDFDSIRWDEDVEPLTKTAFNAGFAKADLAISKAQADKEAAKNALFAKLGITEDEAKLLLA